MLNTFKARAKSKPLMEGFGEAKPPRIIFSAGFRAAQPLGTLPKKGVPGVLPSRSPTLTWPCHKAIAA